MVVVVFFYTLHNNDRFLYKIFEGNFKFFGNTFNKSIYYCTLVIFELNYN